MTNEEFSNEFDVLLNSYANLLEEGRLSTNIEVDEYEKSVFLTSAQEELVKSIYNGKNPFGDSFEKTEELRRYLSELVKTDTPSKLIGDIRGLSNNSIFYRLPPKLWFITYESVNLKDNRLGCKEQNNVTVVPITLDEYHRIKNNPFRGANDRRVLRLDCDDNSIELISKYNVIEYLIRYLEKPSPIILEDLPTGLTINETNLKTECRLNPALHRPILERAVKIAVASKSMNVK